MKIAILSDIHGNLPALQTVTADIETWSPDLVIVNGDIINRGPCSLACWQWVRQKQQTSQWQLLSGNHEEFVLLCGQSDAPQNGPLYDVRQFAHWSYQQLGNETAVVSQLPHTFSWFAPDGSELRVRHGSMHGNRDGLYADASDERLNQQITPAPAAFATAHTHRPFVRTVAQSLVVNTGAVGSPFDGDERASYGRFTWNTHTGWQANIVRLEYDVAMTEQDYATSGFLAEGGPLTQLMLIERRIARGLMFQWNETYLQPILNGEMSVKESVITILSQEALRPYLGTPGWSWQTIRKQAK